MSEHRFAYLAWKPDGRTACHGAVCSCGWIDMEGRSGYWKPYTHEELIAAHADGSLPDSVPVESR